MGASIGEWLVTIILVSVIAGGIALYASSLGEIYGFDAPSQFNNTYNRIDSLQGQTANMTGSLQSQDQSEAVGFLTKGTTNTILLVPNVLKDTTIMAEQASIDLGVPYFVKAAFITISAIFVLALVTSVLARWNIW